MQEQPNTLISAAKRGNLKRVRELLEQCADINQATEHGTTALMKASLKGHVEVVKVLLESGAAVDQAKKSGTTALMKASRKGHVEVVKVLLENGANVDRLKKDRATRVRLMLRDDLPNLSGGVESNPNFFNQAESYCSTALIFASRKGHSEVVKLLLTYKAKPHLQMSNGLTALIAASRKSYVEIARLLLNKGAGSTLAMIDGKTVLDIARTLHGKKSDIFKLLRDHQAKVTAATTLLYINRLRMFPVAVPKDVTTLIAQAVVASREPWVPKK